MKQRVTSTVVALAIGSAVQIAAGCGSRPAGPIPENRPVAYVDSDGSHESAIRDTLQNPFPYMKFADGQITLNDRCPVRRVPMNLRLP